MRATSLPLLILVLTGCAGAPGVRSLSGRLLEPPPLPDDVRAAREIDLEAAATTWRLDPSLDAAIWYGRRTAYLGRYRDAIDIYTDALRRWPDEPHLLRHRGHRWITLRRFPEAIEDLTRAAAGVAGKPDEVEPDGMPNARGIPTSTLQSNIWYHLGLAHYLVGDFVAAADAYRECMKVARNPDMLCATTHWSYMTLRRMGWESDARSILEPITAGLDVIENHGYHRLLLLYEGELTERDLVGGDGDETVESATVAYGVANWHHYNGRVEAARALFERIETGAQWAAFGHIAAEVELWGR